MIKTPHPGVGHAGDDAGGEKAHRCKETRHIGHVASHHDDGHGLADGPAHAQHHRGSHTAAGGVKTDAEPCFRFRGTQRQTGLLILPGNGPQRRFRHVNNRGQNHDGQHDDGRQQTGAGAKAAT